MSSGEHPVTDPPSSIGEAFERVVSDPTEPALPITTRPPAFAPPRLPNLTSESDLRTLINEVAERATAHVRDSIHRELVGARIAVEEFVKEHRVTEFSRLRAEERRAFEFATFARTTQHEFQQINERLVEGNDRFDRIEDRQRQKVAQDTRVLETLTALLLLSSPRPPSSRPRVEGSLHRISVLVVEDEPTVRDAVRRVLIDEGADVRTCDDLSSARDAIRQLPPGAVVVDLMLRGEDGMGLVRELRVASTPRIGVVVATGQISESDEQEARALGAHVLVKPYESSALVGAVLASAVDG